MTDNPEDILKFISNPLSFVESKKDADNLDVIETEDYQGTQEEYEETEQTNRETRFKAETKLRQFYAKSVIVFLAVYTCAVFTLVVLSGLKLWDFNLPDITLTTLVASISVAAIGLVRSVVVGLFK